jgi:hypothetical protein
VSLRTGDEIFRHSLWVVRRHPKLLVFPLLIMVALLAVVANVLPPALGVTGGEVWNGLWHPREGQQVMHLLKKAINHPLDLPLLWLAGAWLTGMFAVSFIHVAFYSQILAALNGGEVSGRRGLVIAVDKLTAIAPWSLVASTAGVVASLGERVLGPLGLVLVDVAGVSWLMRRLHVTAALVGVTWTSAAEFVIPVMVNEPQTRTPLDYLRISADMIRRVWGEALVVGVVGRSSLGYIVAFAVLVLTLVAAWAIHLDAIAIWGALCAFLILCLWDGVNCIYRSGLYIYATESVAPGPFDAELFDRAWTVK